MTPLRSRALLAASLSLLLSAVLWPAAARADEDGSALQGKFSHVLIQKEGRFTTTTRLTAEGVWKLAPSGNACIEGGKMGRSAMHFLGFDGTLSWEQVFEDSEPLPPKPWSDETREDLSKSVKRRTQSYSRRLTVSPERHAQGLFTTDKIPVGTLGCVHLDPTTRQLLIEPGFFNTGNNAVPDAAITTVQISMLGNPVPWQSQQTYHLTHGLPLEGRYDPDAPVVAGEKRHEEPPEPGVSPEEFHHERRWTWSLSHRPMQEEIRLVGEHCGCNTNQELTIIARAKGKGAAGLFEPFEIDGADPKPTIVVNEGGRSATLTLRGDPKQTKAVKVKAVFRNGYKQLKSPPHEISFLQLDPPVKAKTDHRIGEGDYLFDGSTPGKLEIPFEKKGAWKDGQAADDEVQWEISGNGSGRFKTQRTAKEVKLVADRLFDTNDEFGERTLTGTLETNDCKCEAEPVTVRLFFMRDEKNNPFGKVPNWAFYWAQTKAGRKVGTQEQIRAQYVDRLPPPVHVLQNAGVEAARYEAYTDTLYIPRGILTTCCSRLPGGDKADEGIDCYAVGLNHENRHREQFLEWWGPRLARYPCHNAGVPYACPGDRDSDFVPPEVETANGCHPNRPTSCPRMPNWCGPMTDLEMDAYDYGWKWVTGSADKEDWGCPGKQCAEKK